ncbi:hypothetical protein lbkm_0666 [Lachnospiraceae bacterium KM106-2]|nr:hypothetical protein lbkm_0666 [Lachnospiraceae bacterium KM106-2]
MTKEAVEKAIKRVNRGIVIATENVEKGVQVKESKDGIEDLKVCKEALEKQLPKKPLRKPNENHDYEILTCPVCGSYISGISTGNYCRCGQKLDWSETDE